LILIFIFIFIFTLIANLNWPARAAGWPLQPAPCEHGGLSNR